MPKELTTEDHQEIRRRMAVLEDLYNEWATFKDGICLNSWKLRTAVTSWMHDLNRLKDFHSISTPDRHKDAAFMAYWISKIQPVQSVCTQTKTKPAHLVLSNAEFGLHYAYARLKIQSRHLEEQSHRHLLYALFYRSVQPEALSLSFYFLETAYNAGCLRKVAVEA